MKHAKRLKCKDLSEEMYVRPNVSSFTSYLAAPSQAPANLRWEQQGSELSLGWEPVRPLANESEVMGYKVSVSSLPWVNTGLKHCYCEDV